MLQSMIQEIVNAIGPTDFSKSMVVGLQQRDKGKEKNGGGEPERDEKSISMRL